MTSYFRLLAFNKLRRLYGQRVNHQICLQFLDNNDLVSYKLLFSKEKPTHSILFIWVFLYIHIFLCRALHLNEINAVYKLS